LDFDADVFGIKDGGGTHTQGIARLPREDESERSRISISSCRAMERYRAVCSVLVPGLEVEQTMVTWIGDWFMSSLARRMQQRTAAGQQTEKASAYWKSPQVFWKGYFNDSRSVIQSYSVMKELPQAGKFRLRLRSEECPDCSFGTLRPGSLAYDALCSADGKWIMFTSDRNGSSDINRVHLDGSRAEGPTDVLAIDDKGALSADGSTGAFVASGGGDFTNC
jgi:hypothetical protein